MSVPPQAQGLRIRTHRPGAGLQWVRQGLRLFAGQPLVLIVLVGLGPLFLASLQVVPLLGDLAAFVLTPAVALGMLNVCRTARRGGIPGVSGYVAGLRVPLARLRIVQLGLVYAVFAGTIALLVSLVPPEHTAVPEPVGTGAVAGAAGTAAAPPADALPANAGIPGAALPGPVLVGLLVLLIPFAMAIWFAPALVGWHAMVVPKALFFSFFACWRNRLAILVYLLSLLGLWVVAVMVVGVLVDVLNAKDGLAPYLLLAPLVFLTLTISQCANLGMVEAVIDDGTQPDAAALGQPPAVPPS
jgi:hypothetical protein